MKNRSYSFLATGFCALLLSFFSTFNPSPVAQAQEQQEQFELLRVADAFDQIPLYLVYDVATDARTFRLNRGAQLPDARRGDSFIVEGKIYPGGTLPIGGTLLSPGSFNLDTAGGSIGKWVLRGTFNYDFGEIIAGAEPAVFGTQYFIFNDSRVLVTDGSHGAVTPQLRMITGGAGPFSGAAGDVTEAIIGTNLTGLFNQRFTFRLKKQSIK